MRRISFSLIPNRLSGEFARNLVLPISALALIVCAPFGEAAAGTCMPTGFSRDSINLTAALINPPGKVSRDVDATGCNIGIYYSPGARGDVNQANVHGANYFGIVNNGAEVDIRNSTISDIGEKPFNGTQHGVAIYFAFGSNAKGNIQGNFIWNYQKGGIVVNGPTATANIQQNTVIGQGPINYIAQNGIQAGYGATTQIQQNLVVGNSYTGANLAASGGIILVGGDCYGGAATINTEVKQNNALGNDIGVWFSNLDASCGALQTPTRNTAQNNTLVNNAINNTTGNGPSQGYQAGIADQGDMDVIRNNDICGLGYEPPGNVTAALFAIDVTATFNPIVNNNGDCSGGSRGADGPRGEREAHKRKPSHHK
jgi:hypothetical protein